jgi:hypothetical protein
MTLALALALPLTFALALTMLAKAEDSTKSLNQLLQQSRQLNARISGSHPTSTVLRGIEQIETAAAKLAAKVGSFSADFAR